MAAYLRPRRGTASGSTVVLKEGEIFLDTAKSSSATTLSSWGQIYVGNNSNNINALKPFVALPEAMVVNAFDTDAKTIDNIAAGQPLKTLFKAIKDVLSSHATSITNLNNDKRSISNNTFSSLTVTDETSSYKTDIRSFETHTANRSLYLPDSTGTLATQEWCHTVTSINDKVTWVNSSYINTTYTYFTCAMNKIVYFQIYFAATIASGGQVGTIASGYRFTGQQCWFPIVSAHGNNVYPARLTLATDGKITVVGTVTSGMFCSGMYIIY